MFIEIDKDWFINLDTIRDFRYTPESKGGISYRPETLTINTVGEGNVFLCESEGKGNLKEKFELIKRNLGV